MQVGDVHYIVLFCSFSLSGLDGVLCCFSWKYPVSTKTRIYCIENCSTHVILSKEIAAKPNDLYGSVSPQAVE
jgi:hypothetical protein